MNTEFEEAVPATDADEIDKVSEEELAETVVLPDTMRTDNVGDVSVEINVEQLIADIEGEEDKDTAKKKAVRRKLEDLAEDQSFEDTYAIEFDEE
jgi:hypothetical protein